jgi:hypothetical protein
MMIGGVASPAMTDSNFSMMAGTRSFSIGAGSALSASTSTSKPG